MVAYLVLGNERGPVRRSSVVVVSLDPCAVHHVVLTGLETLQSLLLDGRDGGGRWGHCEGLQLREAGWKARRNDKHRLRGWELNLTCEPRYVIHTPHTRRDTSTMTWEKAAECVDSRVDSLSLRQFALSIEAWRSIERAALEVLSWSISLDKAWRTDWCSATSPSFSTCISWTISFRSETLAWRINSLIFEKDCKMPTKCIIYQIKARPTYLIFINDDVVVHSDIAFLLKSLKRFSKFLLNLSQFGLLIKDRCLQFAVGPLDRFDVPDGLWGRQRGVVALDFHFSQPLSDRDDSLFAGLMVGLERANSLKGGIVFILKGQKCMSE